MTLPGGDLLINYNYGWERTNGHRTNGDRLIYKRKNDMSKARVKQQKPVEQNSSESCGTISCPMDSSWRKWDLSSPERFGLLDPADKKKAIEASKAKLGKLLSEFQPAWQTASDDSSLLEKPHHVSFYDGYPKHEHVELSVDGHLIHIDRLSAKMSGPGRSYLEYRIYVDGQLAGRGGGAGAIFGMGNSDLPARALCGMNRLITVDREKNISYWECTKRK